jgi:hypothetical protein
MSHAPGIHLHHTVTSMPCNHMCQCGLAQPWGPTQQRHLQPRWKMCCTAQVSREHLQDSQRLELPHKAR